MARYLPIPEDEQQVLRDLYRPVSSVPSITDESLRLNGYLRLLREAGYTLQEIGEVVGISRERVRQRVTDKPYSYVGLPSVRVRELAPVPSKPVTKKLHVSPEVAEQLREMRDICSTVNGGTAADDPRRQVSVEFTAILANLVERGVTVYELAKALGCNHQAIYGRLARHGYRTPVPSQTNRPYKGQPTFPPREKAC
jgi:hypothetical protein